VRREERGERGVRREERSEERGLSGLSSLVVCGVSPWLLLTTTNLLCMSIPVNITGTINIRAMKEEARVLFNMAATNTRPTVANLIFVRHVFFLLKSIKI
jgi:hypothetical protein